MKLKFIDVSGFKSPKATIHVTGKLGFGATAAELMGLNKDAYFRVAIDEESTNKDTFFLCPANKNQKSSFKVCSAGPYFYMNLAPVFDVLRFDYVNNKYAFSISREAEFFKFELIVP